MSGRSSIVRFGVVLLALGTGACERRAPPPGPFDAGSYFGDPAVGSPAPDGDVFTLQNEQIRLSSRLGDGTTVLLFGNFTCPGFRGWVDSLKTLAHHYESRASFLLLYQRESHPTGQGGQADILNKTSGICLRQPTNNLERVENAKEFVKTAHWEIPTLVVPVDDALATRNVGPRAPMRLLILEHGLLRYHSASGFIDVDEADAWLARRFPELPHTEEFRRSLHPESTVEPRPAVQ